MGSVSNSTGRIFMPGTSPNGKLASQISSGSIGRFPVLKGVDILALIGKLVLP